MNTRKALMFAGAGAAGLVVLRGIAKTIQKRRGRKQPEPPKPKGDLIGKECILTTLRVDEGFGQASYDDGGAGLILTVRCEGENDLTRGSRAVIVDYHEAHDTYTIKPLGEEMASIQLDVE